MTQERGLIFISFVLAMLVTIKGGSAAQAPGDQAGRDAPAGVSLAAGQAVRNQIGVFLRSTGRSEPAEALVAVKAVRLDMIQISKLPDRFYTPEGAQEFGRMMTAAGLRAASVVVVFDGESYRDLDAVEATVGFRPAHLLDARLAYARRCVDFAAALGVKIVTFHMGVLPKDPADPTYQQMLNATTSIASYAAARGTSVSLETGQETGEELARFLDGIKVARVGVNFDIANFILYGMDNPADALARVLDRVTSVHVKDGIPPAAPRRLGTEVRLGEGRGEVKRCLEILRNAGFMGPLVIENYVSRELGTDPLDELRRAKAFIEKTLEELAQRPAHREE
jgi:L-ribulose-5-phosphate 3-epimerase